MIKKACEWCRQDYTPKPYREDKQRFCSRLCSLRWSGQQRHEATQRKYPAVQKLCEHCSKPYQPLRFLQETQRFCSKSCARLGVPHRNWDGPASSEKVCEQCQQPFLVLRRFKDTQRFCSKVCSRRGQAPRTSTKRTKQCEHCGGDYQVVPYFYATRRFCNRECWRLHMVASEHGAWKGGTGWYKKQKGPACERCGSTQRRVVHHKDENRDNNALENLETLCYSCHLRHHRLVERMREQGVDSPEKVVKHRNPQHTEKSRYPYRKWRTAILERDARTCQECGKQQKTMYVHHIEPWETTPALRYEISNGMTLCYTCHHDKHHS